MTALSRRALFAASAAAATLPFFGTTLARAAAPAAGKQGPGFYRFRIGDYEITAINDGTWYRALDDKFVRNAAFAEVQKALSEAFLPTDKLPIPFTALVVNTGSKLIALDTGTGGQLGSMAPQSGTFAANLAAAGIDPKSIDTIVISHFHPDHINGIKTKDNALFFPNAEINVPAPEWAFWMDDGNMSKAPEAVQGSFRNARRIFADIAKDVKRFEPGKEVAPGITSIAAFGIRSATRPTLSPLATSQCSIWRTPPTIPGCLCAIRGGRRSSTWTATWPPTTASACSTAPRPTGCWCTAIISPSRPRATSPKPRPAMISCR